jgi:hypothetical protein
MLTQGRQILDGYMFLHLKSQIGAWIDTDDPERVAGALGIDVKELYR